MDTYPSGLAHSPNSSYSPPPEYKKKLTHANIIFPNLHLSFFIFFFCREHIEVQIEQQKKRMMGDFDDGIPAMCTASLNARDSFITKLHHHMSTDFGCMSPNTAFSAGLVVYDNILICNNLKKWK